MCIRILIHSNKLYVFNDLLMSSNRAELEKVYMSMLLGILFYFNFLEKNDRIKILLKKKDKYFTSFYSFFIS